MPASHQTQIYEAVRYKCNARTIVKPRLHRGIHGTQGQQKLQSKGELPSHPTEDQPDGAKTATAGKESRLWHCQFPAYCGHSSKLKN